MLKIIFIFLKISIVYAEAEPALQTKAVIHGEYLARAASCIDCHTANESEPLAGGFEISTPFGIFRTPNISPDKKTGIGNWTSAQFLKALRQGTSPNGAKYYPVFPYTSFSKLTDQDINDIYLYLKSQAPIYKVNAPHKLNFVYRRWQMRFWQFGFFHVPTKNELHELSRDRGAYLAQAVFHCTECHTPRGSMTGSLKESKLLSGAPDVSGGPPIPNITPDPKTGISWTKEQWNTYLSSGFTPSLATPSGEMARVVRNTSRITKEDRAALIKYLQSLRPIENVP